MTVKRRRAGMSWAIRTKIAAGIGRSGFLLFLDRLCVPSVGSVLVSLS